MKGIWRRSGLAAGYLLAASISNYASATGMDYVWSTNGARFEDFQSAKDFFCQYQTDYYNNSNGRYTLNSCSVGSVTDAYNGQYKSVRMILNVRDIPNQRDFDQETSFSGKLKEYNDYEEPDNKTCHPVNFASGNKLFNFPIYQGQGLFPLSFRWRYNARARSDADSYHTSWVSSYSQSVFERAGTNYVYVTRDNGERFVFTKDSVGNYVPQLKTRQFQLTKLDGSNNEHWKFHVAGEKEEYFDAMGDLVRVKDLATGLEHTLSYMGKDIEVAHTNGEKIIIRVPDMPEYSFFENFIKRSRLAKPESIETSVGKYIFENDKVRRSRMEGFYFQPAVSDDGNPATITPLQTFEYGGWDQPYLITIVRDDLGQVSRRASYDNSGRATFSGVGTTGESNSFGYPSASKVIITNSFGYQSEYNFLSSYDKRLNNVVGLPSANCAGATAQYKYDSSQRKQYLIDNKGYVTAFTYYPNNQIKTRHQGGVWNGSSPVYDASARYNEYTYTPSGQLDTETLYERNAAGTGWQAVRKEDRDYHPNGRLARVTETDLTNKVTPLGSTANQTRITEYHYTYHTGAGIPADTLVASQTVDGPLAGSGDSHLTEYDLLGRVTRQVNALGHEVLFSDFNNWGKPQHIRDANGVVTLLTYHPRGWLETQTVKDPGGDAQKDAITRYEWYANGRLEAVTDADGVRLSYLYNDAGHVTEIHNGAGEKLVFTPNAKGDWTLQEAVAADSTIAMQQRRNFDELGRLMDLLGNNGQHTHYDYDVNGELERETAKGAGRDLITDYQRNSLNQLMASVQQAITRVDGVDTTVEVKTQYRHDGEGNITQVTDPVSLTTQYTYNGFGEKITQISPDTGTTHYWYNGAGQMTAQRDARGVDITYHYDALGRLTWVETPGGTDDVHYTYDEVSSGAFAKGQLTTLSNNAATLRFSHDARGNLISQTTEVAGQSYTLGYGYTLANRPSSITYPDQRTVSYGYDTSLGQINRVATQKGAGAEVTVLDSVTYAPFGPVTGYRFGNNLTRTLTRDSDYRLANVALAGAQPLVNHQYGYDLFNNITAVNDLINTVRSWQYRYDDLQRLQQADGGAVPGTDQFAYEYDAVGNRRYRALSNSGLTHTEEHYQYAADANQLEHINRTKDGQAQSAQFQYTDAGNLEHKTGFDATSQHYHYTSTNRLARIEQGGTPLQLAAYNGLGQRVSKGEGGGQRHFIYGQQGELLAEASADGTLVRQYVYFAGEPVAILAAQQ